MPSADLAVSHKARLLALWSTPRQSLDDIRASLAPSVSFHGFYPLRRLQGAEELIDQLWAPLLRAMPDLRRRPYIVLANAFEGRDWVASTGDIVGSLVEDFLGIPATGASVKFRYGEFWRMEAGKIAEIRMLVDLPDLIRQADRDILPASYGRELWIPGPLAGDGLSLDASDAAETARTLRMVESMIFDGLNSYDQKSQASQGLERFWSQDLVWHGPVGIGSAYGIAEFLRHAQGPIVRAFPDRKGVGHQARIADGIYAASTGWPSLAGTHLGEFLGWQPTGRPARWNIMDFWRRDGQLLRENWVLIDLIDAALQSGVELYPPLSQYKRDCQCGEGQPDER